jgi:hypothetical protein
LLKIVANVPAKKLPFNDVYPRMANIREKMQRHFLYVQTIYAGCNQPAACTLRSNFIMHTGDCEMWEILMQLQQ